MLQINRFDQYAVIKGQNLSKNVLPLCLILLFIVLCSYHYSGYPREATSYPVYSDDSRGDRGYDRGGGYRPRGGGGGDRGRYDSYGGRGGGR